MRGKLISLLSIANSPAATKATEAHRKLLLPDPTIEEVIRYSKAPTNDYESLAAARFVESILDVRERPLPNGPLKANLQNFAYNVLSEMKLHVSFDSKKVEKEFLGVAKSISRLIALYYFEDGIQPEQLNDTRLVRMLPHLTRHLLAETELCVEAKFTLPKRNLSKVSVFDIFEKLSELEEHENGVVRDNARTIVYAALSRGNLELADSLAEGAKEKLEELEGHHDEVVRNNARTIVSAALNRGNLELADKLANGAKEKLKKLEGHADEKIRRYSRTIISKLLHKGNLDLESIESNGEVFDLVVK